ncbi:DPP IV N-terminal domain-containing protein, partial [Streptomyces sp. FM008]
DRAVAEPEAESVTYGLAEFAAAEEMDRSRGFWWAPDSSALLVERADDAPV